MEQDLLGGRRPRRSGPRSRKGCLTCRGRHTRCDEARPICDNCRKSRLKCQQPEFVSSKWSTLVSPVMRIEGDRNSDGQDVRMDLTCASKSEKGLETFTQEISSARTTNISRAVADSKVASPAESIITADVVHLFRVYEKGIATWMDVFDSDFTYQRHLLCLAPSYPLLLNAICALSARQLSLIVSPVTWKPVAEQYYCQAVHLLAHLLSCYPTNMELAIVGTILLSSYELLAFPGLDYQRHFKGAHTIINSLHTYKSASRLTRASFWIYARHEVAEALNRSSPTLHDPSSWPTFDLSEAETAEDSFCNHILRLSAEIVCIIFGKTSGSGGKRRKGALSALQDELCDWFHRCPDRWKGTQYEEDGNVRYWFPRPNFGTVLPLQISTSQPDSNPHESRWASFLSFMHAAVVV